jgi:hypothetical protein
MHDNTDVPFVEIYSDTKDKIAAGLVALQQLLPRIGLSETARDTTIAWLRAHRHAIHAIGVKYLRGRPTWAGLLVHQHNGFAGFSWGECSGRLGPSNMPEMLHPSGHIHLTDSTHHGLTLPSPLAPGVLAPCSCPASDETADDSMLHDMAEC